MKHIFKINSLNHDNIEWPPKLSLPNSLGCLKNFYNNTDYKKITRYVCSICARFRLSNEVGKHELDIEYVNKFRELLSVSSFNQTVNQLDDFKFRDSFSILNNMRIDESGFVLETNKVIIEISVINKN